MDADNSSGAPGAVTTIRVELPHHLRTLARVDGEVTVKLAETPTQRSLLDALERQYPMLRGTIRDHTTGARRAYLRFYACEQDLSHDPSDAALPDAVVAGREPFLIIGAMSGGGPVVGGALSGTAARGA